MLRQSSPEAKGRIVAASGHAITGDTQRALSLLESLTTQPAESTDLAATALTRAHLLHLDGRNTDALRDP